MTVDAAAPAPAPLPVPTAKVSGRGLQTGLFQRRQPAFWLFVIFLVFTALTVLTDQLTYLEIVPTGWLMSLVLLALYVAPVAVAIYYLDLFEHEPLSLLVAAFLWGGVVSIGFAGTTNTAMLQVLAKVAGPDVAQSWGAALVAPPVEETLKYMGVVVIYLIARNEIDDLIDGFVYGAIIGLGFAAVENIQYFMNSISTTADQVGPVLQVYILRVLVVGAYMHTLWTGISGVGLAYYVTQLDQPRQKRVLVAIGFFVLAIAAHMVWNSPLLTDLIALGLGGQIAFGLIKGSAFFIFLAIVVVLAQRREFRWFEGIMAADTGGDVITADEVKELRNLPSRFRSRRVVGARKGPAGAKLYKRMQTEQMKLALMLSRTDDPAGDPTVVEQRDAIRQLRIDLQALPDVVVATPATYSAALSAPAVPPSTSVTSFMPGHQVPAAGLAAWDAPDPARPAVATLAPGTQLQVIETTGAWSKVLGSNGWTGWVDGRLLVPLQWHAPSTRLR